MPVSLNKEPPSWPLKLVRLRSSRCAAADAVAREAALKAEQEARNGEFAEQTAREATVEAERQAARGPLCRPQSSETKRQIEVSVGRRIEDGLPNLPRRNHP
jgi:hypothetical protein